VRFFFFFQRRLARYLRRASRCGNNLKCKGKWEGRHATAKTAQAKARALRRERRNQLFCASAARAALGVARSAKDNKCFLKYDKLLYKEIKFLKKERKKVVKFLKRAKECKSTTCQRRNERFARRAERERFDQKMFLFCLFIFTKLSQFSRRKQRTRYARRRKLKCFRSAKASGIAKKVSFFFFFCFFLTTFQNKESGVSESFGSRGANQTIVFGRSATQSQAG
jgi:hypothetical protein